MKRHRLVEAMTEKTGGDYYPAKDIRPTLFIPSGCTLLDCILGGGWPLGRVTNIVGDKAVGKTLLAIEAAANFEKIYPAGHIWYREAEAAFDLVYAQKLGLPVDKVDFGPNGIDSLWDTVEDIIEDLDKCLKVAEKEGTPGLYIIDSLDALSSRVGLDRDIDAGSFKLEKPKLMGEFFTRYIRRIRASNVAVIIISQVRDKIGVTFGDKHTRSGGKALDFYASQILFLTHLKQVTKTIKGTKRATGVIIKAKSKKNKVTSPHCDCEFPILFRFGIDDIRASIDWLAEKKMLGLLDLTQAGVKPFLDDIEKADKETRDGIALEVRSAVIEAWDEIDTRFDPPYSKY